MELNLTLSQGYELPTEAPIMDFEDQSFMPHTGEPKMLSNASCRVDAEGATMIVDPLGESLRPTDAQACELSDAAIPSSVASVGSGANHGDWELVGAETRYLFCGEHVEPVLNALGVRFARACGGLVAAATMFLAPGVASAQSRSAGRHRRALASELAPEDVSGAIAAQMSKHQVGKLRLPEPFAPRVTQPRLFREHLSPAGHAGALAGPTRVLAQSAQPGYPAQPGQPAQPGHPAQPAQPGQPAQPAHSAQPGNPAQPAQPGMAPAGNAAQPGPPMNPAGLGATYPNDYGKQGIIVGAVIGGGGLVLTIAGAVVAADTYLTTSCWNSYGNRICSTYSTADWEVAGPLLGVGLAAVVTGGVILGINIGRRKKAGMPRAKVRVAPTHTGWTGSLTMAF